MSWSEAGTFRQNNFDFLRILFALLVVYYHSYPIAGGAGSDDPLGRATHYQLDTGLLAVDGFFAISGFLIAHSWTGSRSPRRFFIKRARRLVPAYIVATAATVLVVEPLGSRPWLPVFGWQHLAVVVREACLFNAYHTLPITFTHNPYPSTANASVWTIKYEVLSYCGLAAAGVTGLLGRRSLTLLFFAGLVVADVVLSRHPGAVPGPVNAVWPFHVLGYLTAWSRMGTSFWAGTTFYTFRQVIPQRWWMAVAAASAMALGIATHVGDAILPVAGTYLLFWFAFNPAIRLEHVARYGDFSYGTYLYAFPIQQLIVFWFPAIGPLSLFAAAAPLSLAAGVLSWFGVERRFVRSTPTGPGTRASEPL